MRNFFKRKPEKSATDGQNQQNNPDGSSVNSFGEDHPYFKNGKSILASEILKSEELQKKFPKLSIWLEKYPNAAGINLYNGCTDLLKIYCFEKVHLDNSYHEFRQFALKNQINEGFNLVLKFERSVNDFRVDVGTAFTDPPFDDLTHLEEAHKYWRQARQQDFAMQLIKFEVNEIVLKKYMELKQTAVHLVSLLAAIDAVTLNCIPYISFSKLMVSKKVIIQSSQLSQRLEDLASKYAQKSIQSIQEIDKLRARFDFVLNSTPNAGNDKNDINQINHEREQLQGQAFKQMLTKQYLSPSTNLTSNLYDCQNHNLSISADSSSFFDFVSHPKCITYPFYKEYEANPCLETYRKLVSGIIDTFMLKGEEATCTTYLCSLAFAQQMAPEIYFQLPELKNNFPANPTKNESENATKTETEKSESNDANNAENINETATTAQEQQSTEPKDASTTTSTLPNESTSASAPETPPQPTETPTTPEETVQNPEIPSQPSASESNTQSQEESQQPTAETEITSQLQETQSQPVEKPTSSQSNTQSQEESQQPTEAPPAASPENQPQPTEAPPAASPENQPQPTESATKAPESNSQISPETSAQKVESHPVDGEVDEETRNRMLSVGFDVFIAADPILTLRAISQNMNVEYSTEGSVKYIINCLKMITPKWKEILKFVVDCSIQEYLPPKLRSIRYVINEIVSV